MLLSQYIYNNKIIILKFNNKYNYLIYIIKNNMTTDEEKNKLPNVKVVLLGDSGVGKTCIISRYISNTFDANSASTNGASYASKKVSYDSLGKQIILDIWDTAGQEKYKSLTKFFYKDAAVCILVYDITLKQSFDNIKQYWYTQIKENADKNLVLGVAGNKSDLYEEEAVPEQEAREYAKSIGAIYGLTSAQNNSGIAELFEDAGRKYLDPSFQQKIEEVKKQNQQGAPSQKITLNKEEVASKEKKRKKGGFC
jgi:Ras-related protein Rab-11B